MGAIKRLVGNAHQVACNSSLEPMVGIANPTNYAEFIDAHLLIFERNSVWLGSMAISSKS